MKRFLRTFASLALVIVLSASVAHSQTPIQSTNQPWQIPGVVVLDPLSQSYFVNYRVDNQSIWSPVRGALDREHPFPFGPIGTSFGLGGYFNVDGAGTFGARIDASVSATPSIIFHEHADGGTFNINYPMHVVIDYPRGVLMGGDPFTINTSLYPYRIGSMVVNGPTLFAEALGRIQADVLGHANAKAFNDNIFDFDLWQAFGMRGPHFDETKSLVSTNNLPSGGSIPVIPGIVTVDYHFPNLNGTGVYDVPENVNALHATTRDDFLVVTADVTNAIIAGFGLPPLNGSFGGSDFGGTFRLLDFRLSASTGLGQNLYFDPRPTIHFHTDDGQDVTVRAGEPAHLIMPNNGVITIRPDVTARAAFTTRTDLLLTPGLAFNPLSLEAHGSVGPIDLPSFKWDAFPLSVNDTIPFNLDEVSFDLPPGETIPAAPHTINARFPKLTHVEWAGRITPIRAVPLQVSGNNSEVRDNTMLLIDGQSVGTVHPSGNGNFTATIPQSFLVRPGTFQASLRTNQGTGQVFDTNATTFIVQARPLPANTFAELDTSQDQGEGQPPATTLVGGFQPIVIHVRTAPIVDRGGQVEDFPAGTTLFYEGAALDTSVFPTTTVTNDNGVPVYTTFYDMFAEVPVRIQLQGGTRKITYSVPSVNAEEEAVGTIQVQDPSPTASAFTPQTPLPIDAHHTDYPAVVTGTDFTLDSVVKWDGSDRQTQFVSQSQLVVHLKNDDLNPGTHHVTIANPAPGGGQSNALAYLVPPIGPPRVTVYHKLYKEAGGGIIDVMSVKNVGVSRIENLKVNKVTIRDGLLGLLFEHNAVSGTPATLPATVPAGKNSVIVRFAAADCNLLHGAILHVVGEADGQKFEDSQLLKLP